MTDQPSIKLSFGWHLGNGALGALLAALSSVVVLFIVGVVTAQPDLIAEKLFIPFLGAASCLTIVFIAKRVANRLRPPDSAQEPFHLGASFHVGNIVIALVIGFFLIFIPALGIPILNPSRSMVLVLMFSSMAAILVLIQTVASMRAEKRINKTITNNQGG